MSIKTITFNSNTVNLIENFCKNKFTMSKQKKIDTVFLVSSYRQGYFRIHTKSKLCLTSISINKKF